jgi:large subunit ribosomal protein L1
MSLPKGIGKTKRVIAFCEGEMAEKAKAAGAVEAGVEELVDKINGGWLDFDVAVAHPSVMGKIGKLGRVLGPTGKMPSPKSGTVAQDVATTVREFSAGKVEYRNDDGGNLHVPVGKASFPAADLQENIEAFLAHVQRIRPASTKGHYVKKVSLSATMTPGVTVAYGA